MYSTIMQFTDVIECHCHNLLSFFLSAYLTFFNLPRPATATATAATAATATTATA